jgi:hypothetical protein
VLTILSGWLVIAVLGHQAAHLPESAPSSVSLTVRCEGVADHPRLTFTLKNTGTQDTTLRLGSVLSGRIYMVDGLTLLVKWNAGERMGRYEYHPRRYPSFISGALTDWLAPLPIETSYTTVADVSDFGSLVISKTADLSLEWLIQPPRIQKGALMSRLWTGTLRSNEIRFPEQCER